MTHVWAFAFAAVDPEEATVGGSQWHPDLPTLTGFIADFGTPDVDTEFVLYRVDVSHLTASSDPNDMTERRAITEYVDELDSMGWPDMLPYARLVAIGTHAGAEARRILTTEPGEWQAHTPVDDVREVHLGDKVLVWGKVTEVTQVVDGAGTVARNGGGQVTVLVDPGPPVLPVYWGEGPNRAQVGTAVLDGSTLAVTVHSSAALQHLRRGALGAMSIGSVSA